MKRVFCTQVDYIILTLKYAFNINTFNIESIDFTSGNKEKPDNESSPSEISRTLSEKTSQECRIIITAAGTRNFLIGIFIAGSEPKKLNKKFLK